MTTTQEYKRFQSRYLKDDDVNEYNRSKNLFICIFLIIVSLDMQLLVTTISKHVLLQV